MQKLCDYAVRSIVWTCAACVPSLFSAISVHADGQVTHLDQGWSDDERDRFYYTTQGSQLIPYHWFLALEQADGAELFRADENIRRLGFLPAHESSDRNPDQLPIGFVKDDNPETVTYAIKESFLGRGFRPTDYPRTNAWMGLTCAACHTSELRVGQKTFRIDGGATLADTQRFLQELADAVAATHQDDQKFGRFAERVLVTDVEGERETLRAELRAYSNVLHKLVRRGTGLAPYGNGRLDAFGSILNEICETSLEIPENHFPADAPTSYPFLWNAPHLDWVQWNGSAANAMTRNVGEVLGVFAQLKLTADPPEDQFKSTADIENLAILEDHISRLKAPEWPQEWNRETQEVQAERVQLGRDLYAKNCAICHVVRDPATGEFPLDPSNHFVKTVIVPLRKIGTDPALAYSFARQAKSGALAAEVGAETAPRAELLRVAVRGVIQRKIKELELPPDEAKKMMARSDEPPPNPFGYKARPLNGVWATAPFLHNGSVPTLNDLLLPESLRPTEFFVGSSEFDPVKVGFNSGPSHDAFKFVVYNELGLPIPGNSNRGHSGHFYTQHKGENGVWSDYTAEERQALIEYMKTLR